MDERISLPKGANLTQLTSQKLNSPFQIQIVVVVAIRSL
jgi:hypothetical protein